MANPDYQAVDKSLFDALMAAFKTASKNQLVAGMRELFFSPVGDKAEVIYLKGPDTLALARRLQAEGSEWSRAEYAEALDSLKE